MIYWWKGNSKKSPSHKVKESQRNRTKTHGLDFFLGGLTVRDSQFKIKFNCKKLLKILENQTSH